MPISESWSPEFAETIKLIAKETSVHGLSKDWIGGRAIVSQRTLEDGTWLWAAFYNEGGRDRDILDSSGAKHTVKTLGFISLLKHDPISSNEYLLLADGRVFEFHIRGCEPVEDRRTFIQPKVVNTALAETGLFSN